MLTKRSRFVRLASSIVEGDHNCQAVGLCICERTYGLLLSAQRFVRETTLSCESAIVANVALWRLKVVLVGFVVRLNFARGRWLRGERLDCVVLVDASNCHARVSIRLINRTTLSSGFFQCFESKFCSCKLKSWKGSPKKFWTVSLTSCRNVDKIRKHRLTPRVLVAIGEQRSQHRPDSICTLA